MVSLRRHLLVWLLCALALGVAMLALASYFFTLEEMSEVFDDQLRQVALSTASQRGYATPARPGADAAQREGGDIPFVTQAWTPDGTRIFSSAPESAIPFSSAEGFSDVATPSGAWRVYTAPSESGVVQIAHPVDAREELAADVALKLLLPSLLMALVVASLLVYSLRRGLRPLARATEELRRKSTGSLDSIPVGALPEELLPFVNAINDLMLRLSDALSQQRRFVADAAHELRTPLTALSLQLQVLAHASGEQARNEALADMRAGLDRATHLVVQLLSLSRLEPDGVQRTLRPVDLAALARSVVGDFSDRAGRRAIDLGAQAGEEAVVAGDEEELRVLLNNLVDNALRYTPAGGRVDVTVGKDPAARTATLEVSDDGPGVAKQEREYVLRRFYRVGGTVDPEGAAPGTGLGLAIVSAIAVRHAASVELRDGLARTNGGCGLAVRIRFDTSIACNSLS